MGRGDQHGSVVARAGHGRVAGDGRLPASARRGAARRARPATSSPISCTRRSTASSSPTHSAGRPGSKASAYPVLRGTIRNHVTKRRRPFVRILACSRIPAQAFPIPLCPSPSWLEPSPSSSSAPWQSNRDQKGSGSGDQGIAENPSVRRRRTRSVPKDHGPRTTEPRIPTSH